MADLIADIRFELARLGVAYPTVARIDEITVTDHRNGNVVVSGSPGSSLRYFGTAPAILQRLQKLPTKAGREQVGSEFA
jgi:hypothetical protein